MELGKIGAFVFMDAMPAQESIAFCQRVEKWGYKVVWSPEAWGREPDFELGSAQFLVRLWSGAEIMP